MTLDEHIRALADEARYVEQWLRQGRPDDALTPLAGKMREIEDALLAYADALASAPAAEPAAPKAATTDAEWIEEAMRLARAYAAATDYYGSEEYGSGRSCETALRAHLSTWPQVPQAPAPRQARTLSR